MQKTTKRITGFRDLEVYRNSYHLSIIVMTRIIPRLPDSERFDLRDQLARSCKAVPRLIAEGYAKKHQKAGFQKYLDDAMAEASETIVGLEHCRDVYHIEPELCTKLVDEYDKTARQLYNLAEAWDKFKERGRQTKPINDTSGETETQDETHK